MTSDSPAVRSLRALALIQAQPGITAAEIAGRLGVSDRAVRRHVSALRQAGLSVDSVPGPAGGYRLARGVRSPLLFSQEELVALTMVLSELPGGVADEQAHAAVAKILAVLPGRVARAAQAVLQAAIPMPDGRDVRPAASNVLDLVRAIDHNLVADIVYRSGGRPEGSARAVEPWALVVRHRRWYLLARASGSGNPRTYRVDRIEDVVVTDRHFERPAGLDPAQVFEAHLRTSWRLPVVVDIQASVDDARPWIPFTMGELTPIGRDRCRLTGRTNNCEAYVLDLARTPFGFLVVGGDELQIAAQRLLGRITVSDARSGASRATARPSDLG